jgi:hypothetical protein
MNQVPRFHDRLIAHDDARPAERRRLLDASTTRHPRHALAAARYRSARSPARRGRVTAPLVRRRRARGGFGVCSSSGPLPISRLQPITRPSRSIRQWAMPYICSANVHGPGDGSHDRPRIRRFAGRVARTPVPQLAMRPSENHKRAQPLPANVLEPRIPTGNSARYPT